MNRHQNTSESKARNIILQKSGSENGISLLPLDILSVTKVTLALLKLAGNSVQRSDAWKLFELTELAVWKVARSYNSECS